MTIPILPIPNTTPGRGDVSQSGGLGGAGAAALQQILQALLAGQQVQQGQQGLNLQAQQIRQQGAYQRGQLENEAAKQAAAQQQLLMKLLGEQQVGGALGAMTRSPIPFDIPTDTGSLPGATLNQPLTPEQALQHVAPENRAALQNTDLFKSLVKEQTIAKEKAKQDKVRAQMLKTLPEDTRTIFQMYEAVKSAGMEPAAATAVVGDIMANRMTPSLTAQIDKAHPEWSTLRPAEKLQRWIVELDERTKAKFRPPDKVPALKPVPATVKAGIIKNRQTVELIDSALQRLGADPNNPSNDSLRNPGEALSKWNIGGFRPIARMAVGDTAAANTYAPLQKVRAQALFAEGGKQLTATEVKQQGISLPDINRGLEWNVQRLRELKSFLQRNEEATRQLYPDTEFQPMSDLTPSGAGGSLTGALLTVPGFKPRGTKKP